MTPAARLRGRSLAAGPQSSSPEAVDVSCQNVWLFSLLHFSLVSCLVLFTRAYLKKNGPPSNSHVEVAKCRVS